MVRINLNLPYNDNEILLGEKQKTCPGSEIQKSIGQR